MVVLIPDTLFPHSWPRSALPLFSSLLELVPSLTPMIMPKLVYMSYHHYQRHELPENQLLHHPIKKEIFQLIRMF